MGRLSKTLKTAGKAIGETLDTVEANVAKAKTIIIGEGTRKAIGETLDTAKSVGKTTTKKAKSAGKTITKRAKSVGKTITKKTKSVGKKSEAVIGRGVKIESKTRNIAELKEQNWITPKINKKYKAEFKKYKNEIDNYTLESIYRLWSKKMNEYILFSLFGSFIILDERIQYHKNRSYKNIQDKKIHLIVHIFTGIKEIKAGLEDLYFYLPLYLNDYDEKWIKENLLLYLHNKDAIGSTFDNLGNSLKYACSTLLKYVGTIDRTAPIVDRVLERENMSLWEHAKDVGLGIINPWAVLNRADDLANRIMPSFFNDRNKDLTIKSYQECFEKWDALMNKHLPPLIITIQKATYQTFSMINKRDLNIFIKNGDTADKIKIKLLKRYLQLKVLQEAIVNESSNDIDPKNSDVGESNIVTYRDIVKMIYHKSNFIDYSFMVPLEWEE